MLTFFLFNERIRDLSRQIREKFSFVTSSINEAHSGISEIRSYHAGKTVAVYFKRELYALYKVVMKSVLQKNSVEALIASLPLNATGDIRLERVEATLEDVFLALAASD